MTAPDPPRALQIHRILLPIAGSPTEHAAIDYAAVLAIALHSSITVVHIDELPNAMVAIVPGASIEGDLAAERIASMSSVGQAVAALVARGVFETKTSCIVAPSIATALVELARREHFDLIVMATHARTGMPRLLLGSVAEHVLRHAPCPVLTVHVPSADGVR